MLIALISIGGIVLVGVFLIIAIDIYLAARYGVRATLSWKMLTWSMQYPIVAAAFGFVVGLLMGHFFWSQCGPIVLPPFTH